MKKTTLYIGLNDADKKTQIIDTLEAVKIVQNASVKYTGGATIFNASGIYTHDDGTVIIENTLKLEIIEASEESLQKFIDFIKVALNQESIIRQDDIITSQFV